MREEAAPAQAGPLANLGANWSEFALALMRYSPAGQATQNPPRF